MAKNDINKVLHLTTSLQGSLQQLESHLLTHQTKIESWIAAQLNITPPPIYCSVDVRNSGFKMASIDTNLFPAGFNNLNEDFLPLCIQAIRNTLKEYYPFVNKILLIPEDHTRNLYYYENIAIIHHIFTQAGADVKIGSLLPTLNEPSLIELPSNKKILLEPIKKQGRQISVDNFIPDLILLNNDLSAGVPLLLQDIDQCIAPPVKLGWHSRLKSNHFGHYQAVATELAEMVGVDPWLLSALFAQCKKVNFMAKEGVDCLVDHANTLFSVIEKKYKEYNIDQKPYLVVKADAGTYGMAVLMIHDPEELRELNRKERTRMANIKGGREVHQVIIQEGIPTIEKWGKESNTAEPVIYMMGQSVVGGFYRIHASKGENENLNAPGMSFEGLKFATESLPNRFYAYAVLARLALIAAARELKQD